MDRLLDCVRYGRDRASSSRRAKARVRQQREGSEGVHKDQLHSICISSESSRGVQSHESTDQKLNLSRIRPRQGEDVVAPDKKQKNPTRKRCDANEVFDAPVYPHVCNILVTIFKHNTSSSTTKTRRFGMAGVDRPLIAKDTRFRLNFVGARFGLIFFLKENEMRSNELFFSLAEHTLFGRDFNTMQHKHKER